MNAFKFKAIASFKQGPRDWLCQTEGAAAASGGSAVRKATRVGVIFK